MSNNAEQTPLLAGDEPNEADVEAAAPPNGHHSFAGVLSGSKDLSTLEKALFGIAFALLLLSCAGFGLFAGESYKLGKERDAHRGGEHGGPVTSILTSTVTASPTSTGTVPPHPSPTAKPPTPNDEICITATCVHIASNLIDSIDYTADPCDDFYQFSTGGWRAEHPIPPATGFFGIAQWIDERNARVLHGILSSPTSSIADSPADERGLRHLKNFFDSCADEDALDRVGVTPLKEIVDHVIDLWRQDGFSMDSVGNAEDSDDESWGIFDWWKEWERRERAKESMRRRSGLTRVLSFLHSRGVPALFTNDLDGDVVKDPTFMRVWVQQDGLGLPSKDYYKDAKARAVYQDVVDQTLSNIYSFSASSSFSPTWAKSLVEFEEAMAEISVDPEDLDDPATTYNLMEIEELEAVFPLISWRDYYAALSPRPSFPDPLVVRSITYFKKLAKIVAKQESATLEAYFLWHTAQNVSRSLLGPAQPIRKAITRLSNYLDGVEQGIKPDRQAVCLTSLLENLGILAGRYFVEETFTGDSKTYAEDIIKATINAFGDRLEELDWLDEATKAGAREKADAIRVKIGFPTSPNVSDPKALERYYSLNLPISKADYFGNVVRSQTAEVRRLFNNVGGKRDPGQWDMIPSEVNAYYDAPANEIAFPAGILQAPYFSKDWPEYLAFGAFGSAAGHELTHAFDSSGRLYDKDGRLTDWWSNSTVKNFERLEQCILDQYAQYTMTDPEGREVPINSKFTIGEDTADAGGIAQAFRAWQDRYHEDPEGTKYDNYRLPGLDFTREQLFWLAYGRGWARSLKASEAIKRIYTDPHSPTKYRVIGPLSNDENFQKAWGCKKSDKMNRKDKCRIW